MARLSASESEARKQLLAYIDELSHKKADYPRLTTQIKRMTENNGFTIKGIHYTLWYVLNIEQLEFRADTLGIIPYFYDKAQKYYEHTQELKKEINKAQTTQIKVKVAQREEDVFE